MTSVLVGRFSYGDSGISSRRFSICVFKACTLRLSRSLAILRCLLTPVNRGGRRLFFFRDVLFSVSAWGSFLILPMLVLPDVFRLNLPWYALPRGMWEINIDKQMLNLNKRRNTNNLLPFASAIFKIQLLLAGTGSNEVKYKRWKSIFLSWVNKVVYPFVNVQILATHSNTDPEAHRTKYYRKGL